MTYKSLYNGCIVASVAHAIMMWKYPHFNYEQSWDGLNYSFKQLFGMDGTISFSNGYCCGAVRLDDSVDKNRIGFVNYYSEKINNTINNECLQYLLTEQKQGIFPLYTFTFFVDETGYHSADSKTSDYLNIINNLFCLENMDNHIWIEHYSMNKEEEELLKIVTLEKIKNEFEKTPISKSILQQYNIHINDDVITSLLEMNIVLI